MSGGYTKAQIEEAMLKALFPLSLVGGGYVRVLGRYAGELEGGGYISGALQLPAIFVSFASSTYSLGPYLHTNETLGFNLIAACRDGAGPGAYRMLADIRDALCGNTLGLGIEPLRLNRESPLVVTEGFNAFVALYSLMQRVALPAQG